LYGRTKNDASTPIASAAITADAPRRKHSDRWNKDRHEERRAKIGDHSRETAFRRRALTFKDRRLLCGREIYWIIRQSQLSS
jgi:hypothetical protein